MIALQFPSKSHMDTFTATLDSTAVDPRWASIRLRDGAYVVIIMTTMSADRLAEYLRAATRRAWPTKSWQEMLNLIDGRADYIDWTTAEREGDD